MTERFASVAGAGVTKLTLRVGNVGPWFVDADFEDEAPAVAGRVTVKVGELELVGTVVPDQSGTFGLARRARIVAGAGGWGRLVEPKAYHNDAGIKARTVAEDAARAVGETIGSFVAPAERVGVDYCRQGPGEVLVPASRVLEDLLDGMPWWVGYDGVTHAGPRPATPAAGGSYEVLEFDPRARLVTLSLDDPRAVGIGSVLSERLDAPQTVRELELVVTAEGVRVHAWCGGDPNGHARATRLMRAIAQRATDGQLVGKYRYRVISMASEGRVNLQAVRRAAGLPDVLPVSLWPGIPGAHAELAPGAEVLVEFIEGDRTLPIVTAFAGKNGVGFVPQRLMLGTGDPAAAQDAARKGDTTESLFPPLVFTGTIGGSPATGVLTAMTATILGAVTTGSSKVGVGT
jgi:hypothetical protein